jgi:uncharacterized delta-60 repeat protein
MEPTAREGITMRIRRSFVLACSLVLVASIGTPAGAAPGDLDPTFSSDDIKLVPGVVLSDVAVQPDGRVVVIGRTRDAVPRSLALRYTAAGELDPTFSGDGRAPLRIADPSDVALQTDGKIVIAGMAGPGEEPEPIAVERLTSRGARDRSFSGDGWVTTHLADPWDGYFLWVTGLAIDALGRITVVVESLEYPDDVDRFISLLVQWEPTGARRWAFGTDGVAWARRCDEPGGLAVQADRKLVVVGIGADDPFMGDAAYDPCVTRLNPSGSLDGTFGTNGVTTFGPGWEIAKGVRVSPVDGSITTLYFEDRGVVGRVLADGLPDPSFGTDGTVRWEPGVVEWYDLALQGRKVVLTGWSGGWAVARLTATGAFDATFGIDGVAPGVARTRAVEVRSGTIVTAGWTFEGTIPTGGVVVRHLG